MDITLLKVGLRISVRVGRSSGCPSVKILVSEKSMGQVVTFTPSTINCGFTQPGSTTAGATQCGPVTAPVNVTAQITDDSSGGALTVLSVTSQLPYFVPPVPPGGQGGHFPQIEARIPGLPPDLAIRGGQGPPTVIGQSNGVVPLHVAAGEFVVVTVQFAPGTSTPAVCTATLQINGDTWNPVSIPVTAAVGEIQASVAPITVAQGASTTVRFTVTSVAGGDTTVNLYLGALSSPDAANVTASVSPTSFPLGSGQSESVIISVSAASDLPLGSYAWNLGIWAFGNNYSFSVPVIINVGYVYYFIKSKLDGNVIDIVGASTGAGAGLDAWPQKPSGTDNQLWAFVPDPAGSGYYFIKSKLDGNVIDIKGASTKAGTLLDAWPQQSSGTDNQLWEFVADPAGSGYCFIKSKLGCSVIDIQGASTSPGALLNAYPWKLYGYDNQLWTVVDGSFPSVVETVPVPQGGYSSTYNYILANGSSCLTLTGVKATIYFTEDLVWQSVSGGQTPSNPYPAFSIQLNAETDNAEILDWLQFVWHMGTDSNLVPEVQIWKPPGAQTDVWGPQLFAPVATMPQAARIPAGYSIVIELQNDAYQRVTGATWSVLDGSGNPVGSPATYPLSTDEGGGVPPGDLSPIASFQVTFGGAGGGDNATFSSGAGVIIYEADQEMNVETSYPSCIGFTGGTAEGSNIGYGALEATPSTLFCQAFGVAQGIAQLRQINPNARRLPERFSS